MVKKQTMPFYVRLWVIFVLCGLARAALPYPSSSYIRSEELHWVRDLSDPFLALDLRLRAIEELEPGDAVDMEYFTFYVDQVGTLILRKLVQKKRALGNALTVRILVDGNPNQKPLSRIDPVTASYLLKEGIELKFYNRAFFLNLPRITRRDHRKIFIVRKSMGDPTVIIGGRNISDTYFNLNARLYYLDRDLLIRGPLGRAIGVSFEAQFNHPLSKVPDLGLSREPDEKRYLRGARPKGLETAQAGYDFALKRYRNWLSLAESIVRPSDAIKAHDERLRSEVARVAEERARSSPELPAHQVAFFTDPPGLAQGENPSAQVLSEEILKTRRKLWMENFQFAPAGSVREALEKIAQSGASIRTLMNGRAATRAELIFYFTHQAAKSAVHRYPKNFSFYSHTGRPEVLDRYSDLIPPNSRTRVHSKTIVRDDEDSIVMTFNLAPRSSFLNAECGVIVYAQPELAREIQDNILFRTRNAVLEDSSRPEFLYRWLIGPLGGLFKKQF